MICPIMSKAILLTSEYAKNQKDLIRIKCQGKDCALWVVAGFTPEGETIEHCGLVK